MKQNTFSSMEEIMSKGEYRITSKGEVAHTIDDVVKLMVISLKERPRVMQLKDLKDLHSKVVLIAGTKQLKVAKFLEVILYVQAPVVPCATQQDLPPYTSCYYMYYMPMIYYKPTPLFSTDFVHIGICSIHALPVWARSLPYCTVH